MKTTKENVQQKSFTMFSQGIKWGALPLLAVALLAAGCTKDADGTLNGIRIVQEHMGGDGGAKVWVDPTNQLVNGWMPASGKNDSGNNLATNNKFTLENVSVNPSTDGGSSAESKNITRDQSGAFYIDFNPTWAFSACYPSGMRYSSSAVSVSIKYSDDNSILNYPTTGDYAGKLIVQFPMVAFGEAGCSQLEFKHVTGAIAFDLVNNTNKSLIYQSNTKHGGVYAVVVKAKDNDGNAVRLWSTGSNANFTCTPNGDGGITVVNNPLTSGTNGKDSTIFYLCRGTSCVADKGNSNCHYDMVKNESVRVVLPIPATTATKFEIRVYELNTSGTTARLGGLHKSRTTPVMNITRNTIYNLGTYYLAD